MRKDYDEPIRWDGWGFRNPAACFETLPSSRGGVSKHATETTDADSIYTYAGSRVSRYGGRSVDTLTEMGLFPDPSENFKLQPVCHLWGDLSANLKQEDISSPASLLEECDAITQ